MSVCPCRISDTRCVHCPHAGLRRRHILRCTRRDRAWRAESPSRRLVVRTPPSRRRCPSRRVAVLLSAPHHPAVAPVSPSRRLAVRTPPSRRRPCVAESPSCCPHPPPRPNPAVAPVSPPLLRARPLSPHGVCLAARGRRPWTRCAASWTRSSPSPASLRPAPTPSPVSRPPCTGKAQSLHGVHLEKRGPSQSGCGPPPADCAPAATQPPLAAAAGVSLW